MKHIVIVVIFLIVVIWLFFNKLEGYTDNQINGLFHDKDTKDNNKYKRIKNLQSLSYIVKDQSIKTKIDGLSEQSQNNEVDVVIEETTAHLLELNKMVSSGSTSEKKNDTLPTFGGWDIYLKQTYNENSKSGFSQNTSLNKNDMTQSNYFNNELTMNTFDGLHHFKLEYDTSVASNTIYWSQDDIRDTKVILPKVTTNTFDGLIKGTSSGLFSSKDESTVIGTYNNTQPKIKDQLVVSLKLCVWTPRPASLVLSENMNFETWNIPKVNMKGETYYNKSTSTLIKPDDNEDVYSYCFGKLKCSDGSTPLKPSEGETYSPYCDDDNKNPVYCAGSALYSVKSTSGGVDMRDVDDKVVSFDLMGQYVNTTNPSEAAYKNENIYYNKFRGLTVPSTDVSYVSLDKDYINYSKSGTQYKFHVCDMFDNATNGFDMNNTVKQACLDVFPINNKYGRTSSKTLGKKCIANKGDPLHDTSYIDYVCGTGETCTGYKCGTSFGICEPTAECGGQTNYQTLED
jgi:hypothetical protein